MFDDRTCPAVNFNGRVFRESIVYKLANNTVIKRRLIDAFCLGIGCTFTRVLIVAC